MDIQQQVAARREELARERKRAEAEQAALAAERKAAEREQREAAVDLIASELSTPGAELVRDKTGLKFVDQPLPPIDVEGLRRSEVERLLNREARRRWNREENWFVIGCIVGGACLIHLGGVGLLPLALGLWGGRQINKRHRAAVLEEYPHLLRL